MENIQYYALGLLILIIGFVAVRKIVGCLFRSVLIGILIVILGVLYYYFKH